MFAKRSVRRVDEDDPITADDRNYLAEEIERCQIVPGPGILVDNSHPAGTIVSVDFSAPAAVVAVFTPVGGIPYAVAATGPPKTLAPGSADCNLGLWDGTKWTDSGSTVKVWNDFTSSTSTNGGVGGKWCLCAPAADGSLRLLGDPC